MNTCYPGRWLIVDLSTGRIQWEQEDSERLETVLGGRGLGARRLWDELDPGIDPLGPENVLIIAPGVLTGTNAPCSGRTTILAKGPATGLYLKSSVGGQLGVSLKMAGVDGLVIRGRAETPKTLWITHPTPQVVSAERVWGKGVRETTRLLHETHGHDTEVACIGQAGEKLVRFASIMTSVYSAAARGGIGAVMGAKRLKAIVVDPGQGSVGVAQPRAFADAVGAAREKLYADSIAAELHQFGTARDVDLLNELRLLPAYNFRHSHVPGEVGPLSGRSWPERGYLRRIVGCGGCIYCCHRFTRIDEGPYAGTYSGGPEYETVASLGSGCGILDPEPVFAANALCNDLGLDTISTGNVIQWAMESREKGVLSSEDLDGLDLRFGHAEEVLEVIRTIATREGVGDLLSQGVARASRHVGRGSERWAVQARGLEHSSVETRGAYSYALAFAVNPRGPDHLTSECLAEFGGTREGIALIERICGDAKLAIPDVEEKRADIVCWHEDTYAISDALGLCAFSTTAAYSLTESLLAALVRTATGIELDPEELMWVGRRIGTLERCFNLREGLVPGLADRLPWRIMNEPQPDLPSGGEPIDSERLLRMLGEYYRLRGWDDEGRPTRETLMALGLGFAAAPPREVPGDLQSSPEQP